MDDQRYTTKVRAKRIELSYFKHAHPFRRWKLMLSIAAPVIAGGWLQHQRAMQEDAVRIEAAYQKAQQNYAEAQRIFLHHRPARACVRAEEVVDRAETAGDLFRVTKTP